MDQLRHNGGRTPFADISNTTTGDDQNESSSLGPAVDPKERKRQMIKMNKALSTMPDCSREGLDTDIQRQQTEDTGEAVTVKITGDVQPGSAGFPDNCSTIDFTHLATDNIAGPNNNISPSGNSIERKRQRDRERCATMSAEQRDEVNKKRREARQRSKGQNVTPNVSGEKNMDPDDDSDWLHRNETYQANDTVTTRDLPTTESMNPCQGPTVATNQSERIPAHENGVERTQIMPNVVSNGDDDEGIIFEDDEDKDNGYLFAGQEEETDEEIEVGGTQDDFVAIPEVPDQFDTVYSNMPEETHMLKPVDNCGHCTAKKFEYEPPGFCCRNRKIKLSPQTTSDELVRLWSSADADARHFRDNIRFFNGHFSFTSLYCWLDKMTTNMSDCGIYTFRAHGMLYHNVRSFGREAGAEHKHLELLR